MTKVHRNPMDFNNYLLPDLITCGIFHDLADSEMLAFFKFTICIDDFVIFIIYFNFNDNCIGHIFRLAESAENKFFCHGLFMA